LVVDLHYDIYLHEIDIYHKLAEKVNWQRPSDQCSVIMSLNWQIQ